MPHDDAWIVAMPALDRRGPRSSLAPHFGRAPCFAVARGAGGRVLALHFVDNPRHHEGHCLQPLERLLAEGARALIVRGIGARSLARLQHLGIEVLAAGVAGCVEDALADWRGGRLHPLGPSAICDGPGRRGRGAPEA